MPVSIEIDSKSVAALFAKLGMAAANQTLTPPMERGVWRLRTYLQLYPPQSHKPQPAKSRKQQIKQIILAKQGKIPYKRTGNLGRSWKTSVSADANGLVGIVENSVVSPEGRHYAPLVQGKLTQVVYHQGTWLNTDENVRDQQRGEIVRDFAYAIQKALR